MTSDAEIRAFERAVKTGDTVALLRHAPQVLALARTVAKPPLLLPHAHPVPLLLREEVLALDVHLPERPPYQLRLYEHTDERTREVIRTATQRPRVITGVSVVLASATPRADAFAVRDAGRLFVWRSTDNATGSPPIVRELPLRLFMLEPPPHGEERIAPPSAYRTAKHVIQATQWLHVELQQLPNLSAPARGTVFLYGGELVEAR